MKFFNHRHLDTRTQQRFWPANQQFHGMGAKAYGCDSETTGQWFRQGDERAGHYIPEAELRNFGEHCVPAAFHQEGELKGTLKEEFDCRLTNEKAYREFTAYLKAF